MGLRHIAMTAVLAAALLVTLSPVRADDYQDASQLFKQAKYSAALEKIDAVLASSPKDARARFLKGLILTEQDKPQEAIKVFTALTQDYPELPEPYNNLAVLYAAQGKYDQARKALEMAIRTHPSYAVAHENLGDVYAKMASEAYDKALQLDGGNKTAQTKLSLIRELFSSSMAAPAAKPAAETTPPVVARVQPPQPQTAPPAPPATVAKEPMPKEAKPAPAATPPQGRSEEVISTVRSWAKAWSKQDVNGYLSHYAKDFDTGGDSWDAWASNRRARITRPKKIDIGVESPQVSFDGADKATVTFQQTYRSDTLNSTGSKTLTLVKAADRWLIVEETFSH